VSPCLLGFDGRRQSNPAFGYRSRRFLTAFLPYNQFGSSQINFRQRRLLAYTYSHGRSFFAADYQHVGEVDRDTAYPEIRAMVKLAFVASHKPIGS